jgi:ribosomal protein L32
MYNDNTTAVQGTGCNRCGASTSRSRLCKKCADADRGDHVAGGEGGDGDRYECVECGTVFVPEHGTDDCPGCGSYRHRRVEVA